MGIGLARDCVGRDRTIQQIDVCEVRRHPRVAGHGARLHAVRDRADRTDLRDLAEVDERRAVDLVDAMRAAERLRDLRGRAGRDRGQVADLAGDLGCVGVTRDEWTLLLEDGVHGRVDRVQVDLGTQRAGAGRLEQADVQACAEREDRAAADRALEHVGRVQVHVGDTRQSDVEVLRDVHRDRRVADLQVDERRVDDVAGRLVRVVQHGRGVDRVDGTDGDEPVEQARSRGVRVRNDLDAARDRRGRDCRVDDRSVQNARHSHARGRVRARDARLDGVDRRLCRQVRLDGRADSLDRAAAREADEVMVGRACEDRARGNDDPCHNGRRNGRNYKFVQFHVPTPWTISLHRIAAPRPKHFVLISSMAKTRCGAFTLS